MNLKGFTGLCLMLLISYTNNTTAQETIEFQDNFVNNRNQWSEKNNEDILLEIRDGKYIFEKRKEGS